MSPTARTRPPALGRSFGRLVLLALLPALFGLAACDGNGVDETPSEAEYLEMVDGWMEHELSIRERAAVAAGQTTNEAFPELAEETAALRAEIAAIEPPEECASMHEAFLESEQHFIDALTFLGKGEDFKAIDAIALANMAKQELKDEYARLAEAE